MYFYFLFLSTLGICSCFLIENSTLLLHITSSLPFPQTPKVWVSQQQLCTLCDCCLQLADDLVSELWWFISFLMLPFFVKFLPNISKCHVRQIWSCSPSALSSSFLLAESWFCSHLPPVLDSAAPDHAFLWSTSLALSVSFICIIILQAYTLFLFFCSAGSKLRALHLLGRHATAWAKSLAIFGLVILFFVIGSCFFTWVGLVLWSSWSQPPM
jgi:hypothetical protein